MRSGHKSKFTDTDYQSFWNSTGAEYLVDQNFQSGWSATGARSWPSKRLQQQLQFSTNINVKLTGEPIVVGGHSIPIHLSERVLTACVAVTTRDYQSLTTMEKAVWTNIPHDLDGDVPGNKPYTSSHMADGSLPSGVNLGMLDGHVEWRPFSKIIPRGSEGLIFYF